MAPENKQREQNNPYPGLRPFRSGEDKYFFGRENESKEIAGKLLQNRFVAVIGASGSGKTSLIRCGLLPLLENEFQQKDLPWIILSVRPGNDPFGNLAHAFAEKVISEGENKAGHDRVLSLLKENPDGISKVIQSSGTYKGRRILLIVDQFEELFRYGSPELGVGSVKDASSFVTLLTNSVSPANPDFYILVALRSDLISECAQYKSFTHLINNSNFLVPRMTRENLREAIEGPVRQTGSKIDAELVERLINECTMRADQLPILQHALMRIWTRWKELDEPDKSVNFTDYQRAESLEDIISIDADEAYEKLDPSQKIICEKLFKSITGKGSDGKGIRYPSDLKTIKLLVEDNGKEIEKVIDLFRDPSLSVLTPEQGVPLSDATIIDLCHETLITLWGRLRKWVDEEASSVAFYINLSDASALYQQGRKGLLKQPDLQVALNWREQNKPTLTWARKYNPAFERAMVYLRTSEKEFLEEEQRKVREQKRKFRRIKIISSILGSIVGVITLLMVGLFFSKMSSDNRRKAAEKQRNEMAVQSDASSKYAALIIKKSIESDSAAHAASLKGQEEMRLRLAAQDKLVKVEGAVKESRKITLTAQNEAREAIEKSTETQRLRMLSIARSMSLRSLQMTDQSDIQALLAYQAYLFNKSFKGSSDDADIYMGLYNIAKQNNSQLIKTFSGYQGTLRSIAFSPGKTEFYTSGTDGKILKWDLNNGPQAVRMIYSDTDITDVLAVSPESDWLACGKENSSIRLIPLKGNDQSFELKGHTGSVKSLVFSFDGKYLYSAALDGKVLKWNLSARTSTNLTTGDIQITSIDISSAGNYVAGITPQGKALIWNPENSSDGFTITSQGKAIRTLKFRPGNSLFAVGFDDGTIEMWDAVKREKVAGINAHTGSVRDIRFNAYRPQMATSGEDGTLKLWNTDDLNSVPVTFEESKGPLIAFEFSPDGTVIISASGNEKREIIARPAYADAFAVDGCKYVTRNFTPEEWQAYVGKDIPYEKTCEAADLKIKIRELR